MTLTLPGILPCAIFRVAQRHEDCQKKRYIYLYFSIAYGTFVAELCTATHNDALLKPAKIPYNISVILKLASQLSGAVERAFICRDPLPKNRASHTAKILVKMPR